MKLPDLKKFSVDDLLVLRDRVNAVLESRVDREQRDLEMRLKRLSHFKIATGKKSKNETAATAKKTEKKMRGRRRRKVAAKYRNPDKPSETWAGRGLQPRWLKAALASGRRIEEFRISA